VIRLQGTNVEQAKMLIEGCVSVWPWQLIWKMHVEKIHVGVKFDGFELWQPPSPHWQEQHDDEDLEDDVRIATNETAQEQ
jgi:hypothetical protein